jgi:hypothetical protein
MRCGSHSGVFVCVCVCVWQGDTERQETARHRVSHVYRSTSTSFTELWHISIFIIRLPEHTIIFAFQKNMTPNDDFNVCLADVYFCEAVTHESDEALLKSFTPQQVRQYFPPPSTSRPPASEIPRHT